MLSYYAYGFEEVKENYWLLGLEYGSVVLFMLYEVFWLQPKEKEKAPKKISEAYLEYKKVDLLNDNFIGLTTFVSQNIGSRI